MALRPTYNGSNGPRENAPQGAYDVTLISINEVDGRNFRDATKTETRWQWKFEATEKLNSIGQNFIFIIFTGSKYGHPDAKLTKVLDGIYGHPLSEQENNSLDLDALIGETFKVRVGLKQKKDGTGEYNEITAIKPAVQGRSFPVPPVIPSPPFVADAAEKDDDQFIPDWD